MAALGSIPTRFAKVTATDPVPPPEWALLERLLIRTMDRAAVAFVERYTRPDGTLVWRDEWPGMDGSDDGYESFHNFPLFYALGGGEEVHQLARKEWNAVTWQFTQYGQVYHEFDAYYDWMHHGESSLYLYHLGLADPTVHQDRWRALRFAGMYLGEDPEAANWDAERRLIRSPINGSKGPRFEMSGEDWVTHRPVLADYPPPYDDIPGVPGPKADWNDDATFATILGFLNERMARGDVPLNLTATSLMANAYLYTGDEKYRAWILDYVGAWWERARANGGICPDNVGLSGAIGECMGGKWWGGYYGWRWPHGSFNILEPALIGAMNAALVSGDLSWLDFPRSQLDLLWNLGREEDGLWKTPHRHGDGGWYDYRPPDPRLNVQLWSFSMEEQDRERLARFPGMGDWGRVHGGRDKGDQAHAAPWLCFAHGDYPDYPETILRANYAEMCRRLDVMRGDNGDPREWDVHHWQQINPVTCEALVQLTLGAPQPIYHGGLLHCRLRYFDPERRRPGLPAGVAALIERVGPLGVMLRLVNTDALEGHRVLLQAGAFGEHRFTEVHRLDAAGRPVGEGTGVHASVFEVGLGPAVGIALRIGMERFVNRPSYALPW